MHFKRVNKDTFKRVTMIHFKQVNDDTFQTKKKKSHLQRVNKNAFDTTFESYLLKCSKKIAARRHLKNCNTIEIANGSTKYDGF